MANYNQTPGLYRCRIAIDAQSNRPAIDFAENYNWDKVNKCLDTANPLGGLQMFFMAEAYPVNPDGSVRDEQGYIDMATFGWMLISTKEKGEQPIKFRVRNLARIFGVQPADIFSIPDMPPEKLTSCEFDILIEESEWNGKKRVRVGNIAPVGEAQSFGGAPSFERKTSNLRNLDKLRQALRVGFGNEKPLPKPPAPSAPTIPARKATPAAPARPQGLPPRTPEAPASAWTADSIWAAWAAKFPQDGDGAKFFAEVDRLNGAPVSDLSKVAPSVFTALANAFGLGAANPDAEDSENMPF